MIGEEQGRTTLTPEINREDRKKRLVVIPYIKGFWWS